MLVSRGGEFLLTPVMFAPDEGESHTSSHVDLPAPK